MGRSDTNGLSIRKYHQDRCSITKQGSRQIRKILVELASIGIRSPGRIKSFFERLMPKKKLQESYCYGCSQNAADRLASLGKEEVFVDEFPRSKQVKFPKLPKKIQVIGINKLIELRSKASEVIIRDRNQKIFRLGMSDWFYFSIFMGKPQ